jgi:hypothetical protein
MIINKIVERIDQLMHEEQLNNDDLVQLIELAGSYLNLQTIPKYVATSGMSYNGVKNHRPIKELFGVKFVIDNE